MHELALRPRVAEAPVEEEQVPEPIRPLFVARQQELARLEGWLEEALRGQGRVGFVVGEPGSGKTMLLREFGWRAMEAHAELIAARGACNATSGVGDPYLPFLEILQTLLGDIEARRVVGGITHEHARRLQGATPDALGAVLQAGPVLVDTLLPGAMLLERARSLADADAWVAKVQGAIEHRPGIPSQTYLFEQVTRVLQGLAKGRPLLLLLDDLQWSDVASIGLLFHLGRRLAGHRVLVLAAYRPEEVAAGREGQPHPLQPVVLEFQRAWGAVQVDLAQAQGRALVDALVDSEPNRLDPAFREALYKHTDGQALFSAELLRGLQERGDLIREPDGRWIEGATLDWDQLPGRVEAAIAAHMARLPREEQELLSVASVEGEEFHAEVVAQVMGIGEREAATRLSGALAKQHRLVVPVSLERQGEQRLSRYRFRHYLFQQHLYQGLDLVERARLHEEVGNTLETLYGGRLYEDAAAYMVDHWRAVWIDGAPSAPLGNAQIAPQLARHFEIAGLVDRAVLYLYLAASRAWVRSAPNEALVHLIAAVSCLQQMPNAPQRAKQEFAIQFILHFAHMFQTMWAAREAGSAAERALELARQIGEPFWIVLGLYLVGEHDQSARLATSEELLGEALEQAQQAAPALLPALRCNLGFTLYFRGQFRRASQPWEEFLAPFFAAREPTIDELTQIEPQFWACMAPYVWALGYPDLASRVSQTAFGLVERGNYWLASMVALLDGGVIFHHMRHEMQAALDRAAELLALNQEVQSPSFSAPLAVYRGWALAQSGRVEEGIASMRQGLADFRAEGDQTRVPHFLALLAEGYLAAGRAEEGLAAIAEALEIAERTDERYYEAEIHRIHGELLLLCGADPEDVEEAYRRSVAVAQGQEAKSFELRSTMSLAKLLRGQGRAAEAREMLAAIYGWFTEGFDTPDLVEAKGLLEQLKT
jgi:predicted ATPase